MVAFCGGNVFLYFALCESLRGMRCPRHCLFCGYYVINPLRRSILQTLSPYNTPMIIAHLVIIHTAVLLLSTVVVPRLAAFVRQSRYEILANTQHKINMEASTTLLISEPWTTVVVCSTRNPPSVRVVLVRKRSVSFSS